MKGKWLDRYLYFPQPDFEVIACCDDDVEMCVYRENGGYDYYELANGKVFEATHWMDKPEPFNKKGE